MALYHVAIASLTFLILLLGAGFRATPGILTVQLERESGWDRGVIAGAISVNTLLNGLLGPFVVSFMNVFGVRRVIISCLIILGGAVLASSEMIAAQSPVLLYILWGVCVGVGSAGLATVFGAVVADRWFQKQRSVVIGIFSAANAAGSLVFATPVAQIAASFGWRGGVWLVGAASLALVPIVLIFFADSPSVVGLRRYGEAPAESEDKVEPVRARASAFTQVRTAVAATFSSLFEGLRSRDFCLLAASFAVCGASTNGLILPHFVPAGIDAGLSEIHAAGILTAMGALDIVGTLASGLLTERFDARALLMFYYIARGAALAFLPTAFRLPIKDAGLWPYAVVYGLDWIATVPPTKKICDELFPGRSAQFFSWLFVAHQIGAAIVAAVGGIVRTASGTYDDVFYSSAVLCGIAAAAVYIIRSGSVASLPEASGVAVS